MKKKGFSQIDGALSLAIFILFIAWFFVFIRPSLSSTVSKETLTYYTKSNFDLTYSYKYQRTPIIIGSSFSATNYPIIITSEGIEGMKVLGHDSIQIGSRLAFLADLSQGNNLFWIVPDDIYAESYVSKVSANSRFVTTNSNMSVQFSNYIFNKAIFNDYTRINSTTHKINGNRFSVDNTSFSNLDLFAHYLASNEALNHSTYVFGDNSIIENEVQLNNPDVNYTLEIEYRIINYSNYYSSNIFFGSTNSTGCDNYTGSFINFYSEDEGMAIMFSKNVLLRLCYNDGMINLTSITTITNETSYTIAFHNDGIDFEFMRPSVRFGFKEEIDAIKVPDCDSSCLGGCNPAYTAGVTKGIFIYEENCTYNICVSGDGLHTYPASGTIRSSHPLSNITKVGIEALDIVNSSEFLINFSVNVSGDEDCIGFITKGKMDFAIKSYLPVYLGIEKKKLEQNVFSWSTDECRNLCNYEDIRSEWGITDSNFAIDIWSSKTNVTPDFNLGPEYITLANVFAREYDEFVIENDSIVTKKNVIRIW